MATFTKQALSAAADGKGILIVATATAGTTIHTTTAETTFDEIWLYATNNETSNVNLTIEFGETSNTIQLGIPAKSGLTIILPGLILGPSLTLAAFASVANKVSVFGYVNRIS